ncbi:MAG: cytochrome c biogenesis protein CcsA [Candidatus Hydrothermarchaeales archaeon]
MSLDMTVGDVLNAAIWLLTFSLIIALLLEEFGKDKRFGAYYRTILRLTFASMTGSLLLLTYYFVKPNFNIDYVFNRISAGTPLIYRVSAVWAGQAGTFLIWSWAILGAAFLISESRGWQEAFTRRTQIVVLLTSLFFLSLAMVSTPFQPTMQEVEKTALERGLSQQQMLEFFEGTGKYEEGIGFVDGMGMNPMLMSPWMAMHPPIIFIGFALAVVPFAASLVYLFQQSGEWEDLGRDFARFSWLFLTVAMGLGGLWAYEELSYGGYWSWDPIESAALIPWLTLTAFIHASIEYRRKSRFKIFAPILAVFTTILIIYATFISRSGVIKSVHGYAGSPIAPYLIFSVVALSLLTIILAWRSWRGMKRERRKYDLISFSNLFYLSVLSLAAIALAIAWGITKPVILKFYSGEEPPITPAYFNKVSYPLVALLVLLTGFCVLWRVIEKKRLLKITTITVAISFLLLLLKLTHSYYFNTFAPIALFAMLCLGYKMYKNLSAKRLRIKLDLTSKDLIHLGIVLILLGAVVSSSFGSSTELAFSHVYDIGKIKEIDAGYRARLLNARSFQDDEDNWIQEATLKMYKDTTPVGEAAPKIILYQNFGQIPRVSIIRGLSDIYVVYYGTGRHPMGEDIILWFTIKTLPLVSLIWLGLFLTSFGMFLSILLDLEAVKRIWE